MKIAIYGAGSLGTILGAYLSRHSHLTVHLINRNEAHVKALNESGATVTGTISLHEKVTALLPSEMNDMYDIIFLLTKQQHNEEVVTFLSRFLHEDGVLCTLQNGLPEPLIASILGEHRVLGATVAWGATLMEPGVSKLTSDPKHLSFGMGSYSEKGKHHIEKVKQVLEYMCPVEYEPNLMGVRWSKLLINATFSGLGTVIGGTFGDVATHKYARKVAHEIIMECIRVGHAAGVTFAPVQGKNIVKLLYYTNPLKKILANAIIPLAIKKHRLIKPGIGLDIAKGKKTEIDYINGMVCQYGRRFGVPTPCNDMIVKLIKEAERGKLTLTTDNLTYFEI